MERKAIIAFGYHDQQAPRHWNICRTLQTEGHDILECHTTAHGFLGKYVDLWKKYRQLAARRSPLSACLVTFPGHTLIPLAWILTRFPRRKLLFDAFISLYDTNVCDRGRAPRWHPHAWLWYIIDFASCHLADEILLDTHEHKKYFIRAFRLRPERIRVIELGTRSDLFFPKAGSGKREAKNPLHILFYGSYIPLHGIEHILGAAAILQNRGTNVRITLVGKGQTLPAMRLLAEKLHLRNVAFREWAPFQELPDLIRGSDACLGIFGNTPKAQRVIPHKVYDAVACGIPVITADSPAVRARFAGCPHVILCAAANPRDLAEKIAALIPAPPPVPAQ